ncbi:MAG: heavy metal translocating P-type ATPase [Balneolaceae bacterium]
MDQERRKETLLTSLCGMSLAGGFVVEMAASLPDHWSLPLYILSYLSGGYMGTVELVEDLKRRQIHIDFLMIAAAIGAAIIDQWLEGAVLLFLFSLSETLEGYALGKSRHAIHALMALRPQTALILAEDGSESTVPVGDLIPGQVVIVKPGEYIPIDGTIREGESQIDESAITGESVPVTRSPGDPVFAATLNQDGVLQIEVTKRVQETTLSRIIELVEKAQDRRAETQQFLDRFEPVYTRIVLLSVTLVILIPWLLLDHSFEPTFYRAMTLLVVASPCALIISTPAAIISAIANSARNGVLFKGGGTLERIVQLDSIAFDKTGTLTLGKPVVTDVIPFADADGNETPEKLLLAIAAGCEQYSEHHLAKAILNRAAEAGVEPVAVSRQQTLAGKGIQGSWNGVRIAVGNAALLRTLEIPPPGDIQNEADRMIAEGKTVVYILESDFIRGLIAMADQIRPNAKETIARLKMQGIRSISMLTGDNRGVAERIANELGIDDVHAELLPEEKSVRIEEMNRNGTVAMVGDGINDAPALATSHLGIAMGAAGTDVALESADVVLMGDDLSKLPWILWLSRTSRQIVRQNITFSLSVIVLLVLSVFWIDLPLTLGVIAHEGSTLLVVLNGLRLLRARPATRQSQPSPTISAP